MWLKLQCSMFQKHKGQSCKDPTAKAARCFNKRRWSKQRTCYHSCVGPQRHIRSNPYVCKFVQRVNPVFGWARLGRGCATWQEEQPWRLQTREERGVGDRAAHSAHVVMFFVQCLPARLQQSLLAVFEGAYFILIVYVGVCFCHSCCFL